MVREYKECPICHQKFLNLGAHMPSCFAKHQNPTGDTSTIQEKTHSVAETSNKSMLDRLEMEMAQQLRILNMQQMMKDIRNPQKPQQQQKSEIDTFTKFLDLQRTMKENILEDIPDETGEGLGFEEQAGLKLIDGFINKKNNTPPIPKETEEPKQKMPIPTAQEIEEAKKKIKSGETSFEEMKEQVKKNFPTMTFTDEQLQAEYDKIRNS